MLVQNCAFKPHVFFIFLLVNIRHSFFDQRHWQTDSRADSRTDSRTMKIQLLCFVTFLSVILNIFCWFWLFLNILIHVEKSTMYFFSLSSFWSILNSGWCCNGPLWHNTVDSKLKQLTLLFTYCYPTITFLIPYCYPTVTLLLPYCYLSDTLLLPYCYPKDTLLSWPL